MNPWQVAFWTALAITYLSLFWAAPFVLEDSAEEAVKGALFLHGIVTVAFVIAGILAFLSDKAGY